jgi:predicted ABC-type ATPase
MPQPELWIVAGANGAGKTTLVQTVPLQNLLRHVVFLNPDDIALSRLRRRGFHGFADAPEAVLMEAFRAAANGVLDGVAARLKAGQSVGVETVLGSGKYRPVVEASLRRNDFVGLIYIWLDSPETACARVERRVARGGHSVPHDKIVARWHRSLDNLAWFLLRVSRFWIYDNSDSDPDSAPKLLAVGGRGLSEFRARQISSRLALALPSPVQE